jgi:CIC family chloride channel protein
MSSQKPEPIRSPSLLERLRSNETIFGLLLALIVGVIAGFGAVVFWRLIDVFSQFFFKGGAEWLAPLGPYYVILVPAVGGLIFAPIIYFVSREAKGEGPPEVMEVVALKGGRIRKRVMPLKVLVSSLCIGSGGSVGREGPIVQIGSSAGSSIGQWLHLSEEWTKTLVLCGAAGGISATFNAPLAGIVFALEVIAGRFISPRFGYIVISSVSSPASFFSVPRSPPRSLCPSTI